MSVFGDRLRILRKKKKLSVLELTVELNKKYDTTFSKSMISRYENGKTDPKLEYVRIIADYFNVSANYLIGISDKEKLEPETIITHNNSNDWTADWTEAELQALEDFKRFILMRREERKREEQENKKKGG
ncbi:MULTISPECIES: helix-turn-helix domain-containing protein [Oceanobacillus]|uniref:helix-turn-helix domain-containing protein n=1 Tax=Oceanobacillus TaxID=182709 RepID=UPI000595C641|nr:MULTISPECIES: helix-turn-helix transcriptional regulator [Oceanobacillus]